MADSIAALTPTLCRLLGLEPPRLSSTRPLLLPAGLHLGIGTVDRVLVYIPDAIGKRFLLRHSGLDRVLRATANVDYDLAAPLPPKTPVSLASMFTGALPEAHGIRRYEKPVLSCDTLFDALLRAGKRAAIVAVTGSTVDTIFRKRELDYYSEEYDPQVSERALELLAADQHELIVAYHQEYDDALHRTQPESDEALAAARRHVETYIELCRAADERWRIHNRVVLFAPDHGAHIDPATGRGVHGDDIPDDVEVTVFVRLARAAPTAESIRQAWDAGAESWDDFVRTGKDWYRHEVHGPALLEACGEVRGLRVLDIGCGQGFFTRALARKGAQVVGVDISAQQVESARNYEAQERLGIEYQVLDAADVAGRWPARSFDLVTACFALGDMAEPARALSSAYHVLRPAGRLVLSDAHPCSDTVFREWELDSDGRRRALKIDRYFDTGPWTCQWNMKRLKYHWDAPAMRYTLGQFSRLFEAAGFSIKSIREPRPTLEQVARIPDLDDCYRLPYALVFELVKPDEQARHRVRRQRA